jgi:uncharacterized membrane protein YccC
MMGKMTFEQFEQSAAGQMLAQHISAERQSLLKREFLEQIQPFIQMQANILSLQPVRYVTSKTAFMEREIMWDASSKSTFDMLDEHIKYIGRRLGILAP